MGSPYSTWMRWLPFLSLVAAGRLLAACGEAPADAPEPYLWPRPEFPALEGPIFDELAYLGDVSSWAAGGCGPGQPHDAGHMGDFGVGNGHVFALSGYACPLNTLHTMAGPDYQQEASFYPDTWFEVFADEKPLEIARGFVFRPRRTAVLISSEEAGDLRWHAVTFAPPGGGPTQRALVRLVEIHNRAKQPSPSLSVVTHDGDASREGRLRRLTCLAPAPCPDPSRVAIGSLGAGEWKRLVFAYLTGRDEAECQETLLALQGTDPATLLGATRDAWERFFDGAPRLESPDVRVDDLFEGVLVTVRAQQTYLGGISPMSRYSLMWIRDTAGTVRLLARAGLFEDARALIDYYHRAAAARGDVNNAVDLDVPAEPPPPEPEWDALGPFSGRQAAEGPSYIPLMAHWYARAAGDAETPVRLYPMLRRCLLSQTLDEHDLLTFSGDETYRAAMSLTLGLPIEHDYPGCCRSANSSFLFVAAAEALAGYSRAAGRPDDEELLLGLAARVRQAADATYRRPDGTFAPFVDLGRPGYLPPCYEDVSTQPLWTGYHSPDDAAARENLDGCVRLLDNGNGFLQSPLHPDYQGYMGLDIRLGVHTGMTPGYYLYNLAAVDHPQLEAAFNALGTAASPSGNYSEYHIYDDHSVLQPIYDSSGSLGDLTARYRHWEGAIDMDALLFALTGLDCDGGAPEASLAPRLVNDWPRMRWRNLRCGSARFELLVEELGGRRRITMSPSQGELSVRLAVPLPAASIRSVSRNGERLQESDYRILSWFGLSRVELLATVALAGQPVTVEVEYRVAK